MRDVTCWGRTTTALAACGAVVLAVAALVASAGPAAADVDGSEQITDQSVALQLRDDGSMHVTEKITYDFGTTSDRHGIERFVPVRFRYSDDLNRLYPISNVTASSPSGAPADVEVTNADITTVRIGDASRTVRGVQVYVLQYDLGGAINSAGGGQELYWNVLGHDAPVPVRRAAVTVTGPGAAVQRAMCFEGRVGSTEPCSWSVGGGSASFTATRSLAPHEGLTVVAGFPAGTFPNAAPILRERWKITKAFEASAVSGGAAVVVLAVLAGGTALLVSRRGRDRRYLGLTPGLAPGLGDEGRTGWVGRRRPPVAVRFTPPEALRVGELGTLVDERANVEDVTATIIDLAVRGYLRIEEVSASTAPDPDDAEDDAEDDTDAADWDEETTATFARMQVELDQQIAEREAKQAAKAERKAARRLRWGLAPKPVPVAPGSVPPAVPPPRSTSSTAGRPTDWVLVKTGKRTDDLRDYEDALYDAIFSGRRRRVRLSQLKTTFNADLHRVQKLLYLEVTERGWFTANPQAVRGRWLGFGGTVLGIGVVGTVLLAIFTHLALIGVALTMAGAIMMVLAGRMPARTAAGTALLDQVQGFRLYLETAEADQLRFEEGQDVFSRYLPYAIVFGVAQRWADLFARLAASGVPVAAPSWYGGSGYGWGGGFDYHGFNRSLTDFSTETTSSIAASAPSASGSSGFSGGFSGGGGGGGGVGSW